MRLLLYECQGCQNVNAGKSEIKKSVFFHLKILEAENHNVNIIIIVTAVKVNVACLPACLPACLHACMHALEKLVRFPKRARPELLLLLLSWLESWRNYLILVT